MYTKSVSELSDVTKVGIWYTEGFMPYAYTDTCLLNQYLETNYKVILTVILNYGNTAFVLHSTQNS